MEGPTELEALEGEIEEKHSWIVELLSPGSDRHFYNWPRKMNPNAREAMILS